MEKLTWKSSYEALFEQLTSRSNDFLHILTEKKNVY